MIQEGLLHGSNDALRCRQCRECNAAKQCIVAQLLYMLHVVRHLVVHTNPLHTLIIHHAMLYTHADYTHREYQSAVKLNADTCRPLLAATTPAYTFIISHTRKA
jgi:hypothetical protein